MKYIDFLKTVKKCPFCFIDKQLVIKNLGLVYLKIANAPYCKDHLLVIPRRHVVSFLKLNLHERSEIDLMIQLAVRSLHSLGYKDVSILVRDGLAVGKSVKHLHYHIIPTLPIGPSQWVSKNREVLSTIEETKRAKQMKKHL